MNNIFRVSHILQTYYKSLQASQLTPKYERNEENIGHIMRDERAITGLLLA